MLGFALKKQGVSSVFKGFSRVFLGFSNIFLLAKKEKIGPF